MRRFTSGGDSSRQRSCLIHCMQMEEYERYWVAGFLEGEGCFTVNRVKEKIYLRIQVTSVDKDVLERLCACVGSGHVSGPHKIRKDTHNATYAWRMNMQREVLVLLRSIYSLMGERRKKQIRVALREVGYIV